MAQAALTLPALYGSFRLKEPMTTKHAGTGGVLAAPSDDTADWGATGRTWYSRWLFPLWVFPFSHSWEAHRTFTSAPSA